MSKKHLFNEILKDTGRGVKGYFKSRLIIMGLTFIILSIGLTIIDAPFSILMAFLISLVDIIPLLGSGIVMIPWAIISYFWVSKDLAIGLAIVYVVTTVLKQVLEPKILGDQIGLKPIYTFLATIIGSVILGPFGLILGPIVAVIINSIIKVSRRPK